VLVDDRGAALEGADALVICTEWKEFRALNTELFLEKLARPIIVDGRNLYDPDSLRDTGITYLSVGRPTVAGGPAP
jgi:UDPglucose 6-dehydrogenase